MTFTAAETSSLEDFIHKSLKEEQMECIRKITYLKEDVLACYYIVIATIPLAWKVNMYIALCRLRTSKFQQPHEFHAISDRLSFLAWHKITSLLTSRKRRGGRRPVKLMCRALFFSSPVRQKKNGKKSRPNGRRERRFPERDCEFSFEWGEVREYKYVGWSCAKFQLICNFLNSYFIVPRHHFLVIWFHNKIPV